MTDLEKKAKRKIHSTNWRKTHPGYAAKWRAAHPGRQAISTAKWRAAHPGRHKADNARYYVSSGKAKRAEPENAARRIANRVGIPIEIPNRSRPDLCECCNEKPTHSHALHFDHCHEGIFRGRFRGWCCHRCNTGNGLADSPNLLRRRLAYLDRPLQPEPIRWALPK